MPGDLEFLEYKAYVQQKCWEKAEDFMAPLGRYDGARPVPHPGCTVLATPYPVTSIAAQLDSLQSGLGAEVHGFARVPSGTYHMTIANLLSGARYETALGEKTSWDSFDAEVKSIIGKHRQHTIDAQIVGLGAFPGAIVAIVDFPSQQDYRKLVELRNDIYSDETVSNFGVPGQSSFLGHITLGYVESRATNGLDLALDKVREQMPVSIPFVIAGAGLYRFSDMSQYDPI
jgi:2'-5' RNA ligase